MIRATLTQATQFVLQKNHLAGNPVQSVAELVQSLIGLPAEPYVTPFFSAFARMGDDPSEALQAALHPQRQLIKTPLMRSRPYIVPVEQFALLYAATARQRKQNLNAELRLWGIESNDEIEQLAQTVVNMLDDTPATAADIERRLPAGTVAELTQTSRGGRVSQTTNVVLALHWLMDQGKLALLDRNGDWRSWDPTPSYVRLDRWYPSIDLAALPGEKEAQKWLVRKYIELFGPVTEADISFWTGFGKSETARATGALSGETTLAMVEGIPGMLLLLKSQAEALKACQPPSEPVITIAPANDPLTTAHRASRSRYFSDQRLQRRLFTSSGQAKPAILVNGQVVGVWDWHLEADQVRIEWQLLIDLAAEAVVPVAAKLEDTARFIHPRAVVQVAN